MKDDKHTPTARALVDEYRTLAVKLNKLEKNIAAALAQAERDGERQASLDFFQAEVTKWAQRTFPHHTPPALLAKLRQETSEVLAEPNDLQEAADVFIVALVICGWQGVSLLDVARRKMAINRARRWGEPDAQGVVEHVR